MQGSNLEFEHQGTAAFFRNLLLPNQNKQEYHCILSWTTGPQQYYTLSLEINFRSVRMKRCGGGGGGEGMAAGGLFVSSPL